jgi:uncharacterized protein YprB with RNaseH-like and TPR domain
MEAPKNTVVYDLEIKNNIDGVNITWDDHDKMGLSTLVSYDYRDERFHIYMDDNINQFIERIADDPETKTFIVTFNGKHFDDKVLHHLTDIEYPTPGTNARHIDLLEKIKIKTGTRAKLDDVLIETLGPDSVKSGSGAFAPQMWQEKRFGELLDYNLVDTLRTQQLFEFIIKNGFAMVYDRRIEFNVEEWFNETSQ